MPERIPSGKVSRDKVFDIAKNPKYDRYQRGLTLMVCKCLIENALVFLLTKEQELIWKTNGYQNNYRN